MLLSARLPRFFGLPLLLFFAKNLVIINFTEAKYCALVFGICLGGIIMDWWCCVIKRRRIDTMGENCSCCYVGSGTKATVRSRLTLKNTFERLDLRRPNYKWCISLLVK